MDAVVDTADRSAGLLLQLTASVSVIQSTDVRLLSGFAKLNLDGQHLDPQPTVRGSNGGSETEYEIMRGGPFSFYCDPAISLKLARPVRVVAAGLEGFNLLDTAFSTTGFTDPA